MLLARHAHAFLALGEGGVHYIRSLGTPTYKLFELLYTTDVRRFAIRSHKRSVFSDQPPAVEKRLLYVGQLIERKGLLPFTTALKRWAAQNPDRRIELTFAGDGPLRARLQAGALPPNLRFNFLGNVAYGDLPEVYAKAEILAFPTLADTWGVVVNEALAAGLPVLGSTYSQAVKQLVVDGKNGWTFRADKPEEIFDTVDRCLNSPANILEAMRAEARRTAMELSPARVASTIQAAIEFCLNAPNRQSNIEDEVCVLASDK
jgi:hypothetical protein